MDWGGDNGDGDMWTHSRETQEVMTTELAEELEVGSGELPSRIPRCWWWYPALTRDTR